MRIEVEDLTKRFGDVVALRDVSFEVPPGRRVALAGPNGSGKSTLNRALMGMLHFEGRIRIDGRSPLAERVAIARRMAYVPQTPPSLAVPVRELLRAVCTLRDLDPAEVAKAASRFELDVDAVAHRPFRALSGGMKQKLLISLALASRATLLVLDEPTGSLDAKSRETFFSVVAELGAEPTLLLCSHRLEEVRQLVDHVLVLEEGRLAWEGRARDFLAASTRSLVEVCVADGAHAAGWLAARGFRRGTGDWWVRRLEHPEKVKLLPELTARLGDRLRDLVVRDLEALELGDEGERHGDR